MQIREVAGKSEDAARLAALSQFLLGRAEDTDTSRTISVDAFIKLAGNMGVSITPQQLIDLSQKPPLNNIISNVENDKITFGGETTAPDTMTVDQARLTVDSMAKRAAKKAF